MGRSVGGYTSRYFFWGTDKEISEKRDFFVNCSVSENFQWENVLGQVPTESLGTEKFQSFLPCFGCLKSSECDQMRSLNKNMSRCKKYISHNFRNWALKLKSLLPIVYGKKWFKKGQVTVLQKNYQIKAVKNYLRHTGHSLSGVHLGRSVLCGNHLEVK